MANTTNFNWETPDDTDLVKDGAAAIRTLGSAIDTSLVDLKGGTTGQILSKTSNTDMDFTWVANDVGDITEVSAGTGITGGGTSGAITITNSMATAIDAKGDLIVGTGADTFSRLAVGGTNGHTLQVDSSTATGLKWAAATGGGKVLQVVSATYSTAKTIATTTYTDTDLTASITPSSTSSKILVLVTQMWYFNRSGVVIYPKGQIVRGTSSIYENTYLGGFGVPNATGTIEAFGVWAPAYLDSPSTTSSTTYKTQMARQGLASGDLIVSFGNVTASIILLEIGA